MERYLKNLRAWAWEYLENRRNYPGVHFTADGPSCEALIQDVLAGTGDYSISPARDKNKGWNLGPLDHQSDSLWFWPCFGHYSVDRAG